MDASEQDLHISSVVRSEGSRLRNFIRRKVGDAAEAEDILQEVYYELVSAARLLHPIDQVGAWLMRVARNRIIDHFRRKKSGPFMALTSTGEDGGEEQVLEELLPDPGSGPEGVLMRQMMLERVEEALAELPVEQREVFIAHEIEDMSFKEMSEQWGVGVNTLLSRKRYAVLALRERLQQTYGEWLDE